MGNVQRLLKLADFLDTVPADRFNMQEWATGNLATECGTAGCAMGWACQVPEFKAEGFLLKPNKEVWRPTFEEETQWDAVQLFFGIDEQEGFLLFGIDSYPTNDPKLVADRIRQFVDDEQDSFF